ncbi:hypothetical protein JCM11251_006175 [Rhodosporidiobolus azoricus]
MSNPGKDRRKFSGLSKRIKRTFTGSSGGSSRNDDDGNLSDVQITHQRNLRGEFDVALAALHHAKQDKSPGSAKRLSDMAAARQYGYELAGELVRAQKNHDHWAERHAHHIRDDEHGDNAAAAQEEMNQSQARAQLYEKHLFILMEFNNNEQAYDQYKALEQRYMRHQGQLTQLSPRELQHVEWELIRLETQAFQGLRMLEEIVTKTGPFVFKALLQARLRTVEARVQQVSEDIRVRAQPAPHPI